MSHLDVPEGARKLGCVGCRPSDSQLVGRVVYCCNCPVVRLARSSEQHERLTGGPAGTNAGQLLREREGVA